MLQQDQQLLVRQDTYLDSRAAALQNVESTIHELGGIFQQLAHMVRRLLIFASSICSRHDSLIDSSKMTWEVSLRGLKGKSRRVTVLTAGQVQEQGELAIRIDENVDDTLANVDSAQAQLLKYLNTISSNRWLVMKIFMVLLVFLVIFVVFIA